MEIPKSGAIRVFKFTKNDWSPSYKCTNWYDGVRGFDLVEISIRRLSDGTIRVLIMGGDDTGYEYDYDNEKDAIKAWEVLLSKPFVNFSDAEELGFHHA